MHSLNGSLTKEPTFFDTTSGFPRNDVWETSGEIPCWCRITTQIRVVLRIGWKFPLINEKHHSDLGSNTSSVWNFCVCSSHVISRRNQRWQTRTQSLFKWFLGIRWRHTSLPMRSRARLNLIPIFSHPKKHLNSDWVRVSSGGVAKCRLFSQANWRDMSLIFIRKYVLANQRSEECFSTWEKIDTSNQNCERC